MHSFCDSVVVFTLFRLETVKLVLLQTVKTQMKCCIMRHFIRLALFAKTKKEVHTQYVQWTIMILLYVAFPFVWKGAE